MTLSCIYGSSEERQPATIARIMNSEIRMASGGLTLRVSDPAPLAVDMARGHHRGVRCTRLVGHGPHTLTDSSRRLRLCH